MRSIARYVIEVVLLFTSASWAATTVTVGTPEG